MFVGSFIYFTYSLIQESLKKLETVFIKAVVLIKLLILPLADMRNNEEKVGFM